jgi:hypothetical protein
MKLTNNWEGRNYIKQSRGMKWYNFKLKVKNFFKKVLFWSVVILALAGTVQYFRWAYPTEVVIEKVKEVIINQDIKYPVLDRIALCESGNKHYDKNGQVLMRGNTNKTVDVGKFQINSVWFPKATELGLDLTKEKDNEEFAKYLYTTRGTVDWVYSSKCWNK